MRRIPYQQQPGITNEQELELLAEVYRLALESYRKKNKEGGYGAASKNAMKGSKNDSPTHKCTE
jgi:hypothetical protein